MLFLFLSIVTAALAQQPSASVQLKQKFVVILKQQLSELAAPAAAQMPAKEIAERVDAFTAKGVAIYTTVLRFPKSKQTEF